MKNAMMHGHQLERLFTLGTLNGVTDGRLLEQFLSGDRETAAQAFEAIVERHGPMVLRVCRSTLRDVHAADDAFQATFLVLARKAHHLQTADLLGHWLYRVALKTARKAKVTAAHRQARDRQARVWTPVAAEEGPPDQSHADLVQILHEEINRLPFSYRAAIVVCYLEGLTLVEAAQRLHLPESTIRGRLARARRLLGKRLTRRGIEPHAGLTALTHLTNSAESFSRSLARATSQAAIHFLDRSLALSSIISPAVQTLADGVILSTRFSPLKMIGTMLITTGLVCAGVSSITQPAALACFQLEKPHANVVEPLVAAYNKGLGGLPKPGEQALGRLQSGPINPDLMRAASGPIVSSIPVSRDCMVLSYLPDWNFGDVDNLGIGNNDGGVRTLIDWPAIPVDEATSPNRRFLLALYSRKTISHPPASAVYIFEIAEEWPERTSWKTKPKYEPEPAAISKFEPGDGWKLFDVTRLIRARAEAGRKGHGVVLRFLNEDIPGGAPESFSDYKLVSREGAGEWANRRPLLLVVDSAKPPNPR